MYAELHAHSYFSLLDGASSPEALVEQAVALGLPALALTDHDGLYGAVRFWRAARDHGLHPIIGAEMTLEDGHHLTLLAENQTGYANLSRLISLARLREGGATREPQTDDLDDWPGKTPPLLAWRALADHRAGLIALSGCRQGPIAAPLLQGQIDIAHAAAERLRDIFGPHHLFVELQRHLLHDEHHLIRELVTLARTLDLPLVASNNIHVRHEVAFNERGGSKPTPGKCPCPSPLSGRHG